MKQLLLVIVFMACILQLYAQTGVLMDRYYISGSLALGKGDRTFADSSAWLQLGKDTTKKGLLLPKVLLDSISTTKKGLYVYDIKDSVLYHFDGNKRVRYMTYKDTNMIKQFAAYTAGYGLNLTGKQFKADTNTIAPRTYVDGENTKNIKYADSAAMLLPYLRKIDTTAKWFMRSWNTDYLTQGSTNLYYTNSLARAALSAGSGITYNNSTGVITNNLLTGLAGGQTITGGTAASENLILRSTSNGTRGQIFLGSSGNNRYWESTSRLGIGTGATAPDCKMTMANNQLFGFFNSANAASYWFVANLNYGVNGEFKVGNIGQIDEIADGQYVYVNATDGLVVDKNGGPAPFAALSIVGTTTKGKMIRFGSGNFTKASTFDWWVGIPSGGSTDIVYCPDGGMSVFNITKTGKVGVGIQFPSATFHIKAGTASANSAPIKINTGTLMTTAEAGAIEYEASLYHTKSSGLRYGIGGAIFETADNWPNTGSAETDLYSYTVPLNTLDVNGSKIKASYGITLANNANAKEVKIYFGGQLLFTTGALTVSAAASLVLDLEIVRYSNTVARYKITGTGINLSVNIFTAVADLSGISLNANNILKVTGTGVANNDVILKMATGYWFPNARN